MSAGESRQKLVMICGMPRSGTNLMRRIVGSHSQIAIPPAELNFFRQLSHGLNVDDILTDSKFSQRYELDTSDLKGRDAAFVYKELMLRYARHVGKPIGGDKSPRNEFHYNGVCRFLPDADVRFIHMVRNPFDMIASYKNAPFRKASASSDDASTTAKEWVRSVSLGAARTVTYPDRYLMIRFEDLTADTGPIANRICSMLGVAPEEERMLALTDYENAVDNTSFKELRGKSQDQPKVKALDSRKGRLSREEIAQVGSICGEIALAMGYQDDDLRDGGDVADTATNSGYISRLARRLSR